MQDTKYLQESIKLEIQQFRKRKDVQALRKSAVAYSGTPQKHPYDSRKIILVSDPGSTNHFYFEFQKNDIEHVEELPNVVEPDGTAFTMVRIWVRKQRIGIRCTPFVVEDTREGIIGAEDR
jgi:inorganic pyrophosphatase